MERVKRKGLERAKILIMKMSKLEKFTWGKIIENDKREEEKLRKLFRSKDFNRFDKAAEKSFKDLKKKI